MGALVVALVAIAFLVGREAGRQPGIEDSAEPPVPLTGDVGEETSGNWSTFDEVADTQRTNLAQLRQMNVPPDARVYHDQTIRLMEAGIDMMTKVKRGMERGDAMALTALSTEAQAMQVDTEAAERLGAELRAQYGILAR